MVFNSSLPTVMHIDLNSCFASIEQQANPQLRGKPIVVAAYDSPGGCILASSVEAKEYGVKTGMRVKDGKKLIPSLIVLDPDPAKYRFVHLRFRKILGNYTNEFFPKSIDEFVLHMENYLPLWGKPIEDIGLEIKRRIRSEIGDWLRVSVGIGNNRFLAKTASNIHKPDGLDTIDKTNFLDVYSILNLTDLNGIAGRNALRLRSVGIHNVPDFYQAPLWKLKAAFGGIGGYYWYLRLRGWEIDDWEAERRTFGNSFALPKSSGEISELLPILQKLVNKTGSRLRRAGYKSQGVHVSLRFREGSFWHHGEKVGREIFDSREIYREAERILRSAPLPRPVHTLAVSCFNLASNDRLQMELFTDIIKKEKLVNSWDAINERFGDLTLHSGRVAKVKNLVQDRIAFGGVREL